MSRRCARLSVCVVCIFLAACEKPAATQPASAPSETAATEVDRLRAVPYAGSVDKEADDAEDGVVLRDPARISPGFTLYTVNKLCRADLIDESGATIRTWSLPGSLHWYQADLQPNGDLLVVGCDPAADGQMEVSDEKRYLVRFDWAGKVVWQRFLTAHHDVETTPLGKLLTLTIQRRSAPELHETVELRDESITLLEPDGADHSTYSLYDLIRVEPSRFPLQPIKPSKLGALLELDLIHANAIESMKRPELAAANDLYSLDNVLVCSRHQDRIAIVSLKDRRVVWAWGAGELSGPHDAQVLPSGNILVFDNGIARKRSRVVEIDPRKNEIAWQYNPTPPDQFFTLTKGSAQRLPNGNTLIANSDSGQAFEVSPAGKRVWMFYCPHRGTDGKRATIVRAVRYDRAMIDALQKTRR